jgi:hypothetical protein
MKNILRLLAGGFASAFFALAVQAANLAPGAYSAGSVKGDVSYKLAGSSQYQPLSAGVALPQGATIKTGARSTVTIVFGSGSTAVIDSNSEVQVAKFVQDVFSGPVSVDAEPAISETEIKIIDGAVTSKVAKLKKGSSFTVSSPVGAAGVRGTSFKYSYSSAKGEAFLQVTEGGVQFHEKTGNKTSLVLAGKKVKVSFIRDGQGNVTSATLDLSDLTAAEAKEITDAIGGIVNAAGGDASATVTGQKIIITPVDRSQVSSD